MFKIIKRECDKAFSSDIGRRFGSCDYPSCSDKGCEGFISRLKEKLANKTASKDRSKIKKARKQKSLKSK